jgi:hypothetical protein
LRDFTGGWTLEKRGTPKNEGISNDVYENKRQKNSLSSMSNDVIESNRLIGFSEYVTEKK